MKSNATCTAAVLRAGISWFARPGERTATYAATPSWVTTDLNRVVLAAQTMWFRGRDEGTVLWQCPTTSGEDTRVMLTDLLARLRERDCTVTDTGLATGWFTVLHTGHPTVHLGIGPLIQQNRTSVTGLGDEARTVVQRLARYHEVAGAAWRGTAGLSGTAAIRSFRESTNGGGPLWKWKATPNVPGMIGSSFELMPSRHYRKMTSDERTCKWVHHLDVTAMYLAACGVAEIGYSAPTHVGPTEFAVGTVERPGYWQVRRDWLDAVRTVNDKSLFYRQGDGELVWVTTPILSYFTDRAGVAPEVFDAWLSDRGGRYLRPWVERLTWARKNLDADSPVDGKVLDAVKDTYARTVGMFNSMRSRVYRPDWWDHCRDLARINELRKVENAKIRPLRWNVDSIWVATDEESNEVVQRLGTKILDGREVLQPGRFRHIESMSPDAYIGRFERE